MGEKKLKRLKKAELLHLLTDVVGEEVLTRMWKKTRRFHDTVSAPRVRPACWTCEGIASKLEMK